MMKVIYRILCWGWIHLMCGISLTAQESAFKEAEVAYKQENYARAIELYEALLKNRFTIIWEMPITKRIRLHRQS